MADPKTSELKPGTRLGRYEIIKRLAWGGMAEILLARMTGIPGFEKIVVLKRIKPELSNDPDFVHMLLDEARIAATLAHPNLVQTYDAGEEGGDYFIAMEYLHGEDMVAVLRALARAKQRMPLDHALTIAIGLCAGLHHAHEKAGSDGRPLHVVHRDVSPHNVILTYEGEVKLLDFGIAKARYRFGATRTGALKGKVWYMSPEQCKGGDIDRRSDIFSLGILLYEMTVMRRLYRGSGDFEVMREIVEGRVVPPRELVPRYPLGLERIVMRALAKDRAQRFSTAAEMQAELEELARAERAYVATSALQQFMLSVFGPKIEEWRSAQAQGKSLGDYLGTQEISVANLRPVEGGAAPGEEEGDGFELDDDDLEELDGSEVMTDGEEAADSTAEMAPAQLAPHESTDQVPRVSLDELEENPDVVPTRIERGAAAIAPHARDLPQALFPEEESEESAARRLRGTGAQEAHEDAPTRERDARPAMKDLFAAESTWAKAPIPSLTPASTAAATIPEARPLALPGMSGEEPGARPVPVLTPARVRSVARVIEPVARAASASGISPPPAVQYPAHASGVIPPGAVPPAARSGILPPPDVQYPAHASGIIPPGAAPPSARSSGIMPPQAVQYPANASGIIPPAAAQHPAHASGILPPPAVQYPAHSSGIIPPQAAQYPAHVSGIIPPQGSGPQRTPTPSSPVVNPTGWEDGSQLSHGPVTAASTLIRGPGVAFGLGRIHVLLIVLGVLALVGLVVLLVHASVSPPPIEDTSESAGAGTLIIDSRPPGSSVVIDGEGRGETPTTVRVPAGRHVIELTLAGHREKLIVNVAEGETVERRLDMRR